MLSLAFSCLLNTRSCRVVSENTPIMYFEMWQAALLLSYLSNFQAIGDFEISISHLFVTGWKWITHYDIVVSLSFVVYTDHPKVTRATKQSTVDGLLGDPGFSILDSTVKRVQEPPMTTLYNELLSPQTTDL